MNGSTYTRVSLTSISGLKLWLLHANSACMAKRVSFMDAQVFYICTACCRHDGCGQQPGSGRPGERHGGDSPAASGVRPTQCQHHIYARSAFLSKTRSGALSEVAWCSPGGSLDAMRLFFLPFYCFKLVKCLSGLAKCCEGVRRDGRGLGL